MKTQIVLYDGFDELDAVAPYEVLVAASKRGAPFEVELVHLEGPREVTGSQGLVVRATGALAAPLDLLIVPGGQYQVMICTVSRPARTAGSASASRRASSSEPVR